MSKYKDMAMAKASGLKGGVKDLKGGVKGKVNGVLGRKKPDTIESDHVAAPLSSLRDPNSFAPPPRRTDSGLAPLPPRESAPRRVVPAPSKYQDPHDPYSNQTYSERRMLEAPPDEDAVDHRPSVPYRMDTTGLATNHLPPPPARRDGPNERSPPSYESTMSSRRLPPSQPPSSGPSLPPRLPPRSSTQSLERINPMPSSSDLNQGAVSRLGAAGISVPAFGIGSARRVNNNDDDDDEAPAPAKPPRPSASQPDALYNRFSKSATSSTDNVAARPSEGTTWAQKQAALKTASAFHKDPTSISFADAKAAASTANNFRERHGHQVAAGIEAANKVNHKYGIADKIGALSLQQAGGQSPASSSSTTAPAASGLAVGKKKPPPPPPPSRKKPGLVGVVGGGSEVPGVPQANSHSAHDGDAPPPIPFATRPTF